MLPLSNATPGKRSGHRYSYVATYLRRIVKPKQMDFEYTFWFMLQLCISPKTAYRQTSYHKQTKNQWARDDPAFVVLCSVLVALAGTAYCITYSPSFWRSLTSILSAVFVDFLALGGVVATIGWFLANRFLRRQNLHQHQVEQHVEWLYAFDVHCNAYFPLFLLLYVLQFFLSPLLLLRTFLSQSLSYALYAIALGHYSYLTFLGYSALPFLERTEVFLWPVGAIFLSIPFAVLLGFNPTQCVLKWYFRGQ